MSLNDLLEAALLHCKAECEAITAELQQIVVTADPENLVELAPMIHGVLERLKAASDRLHDASTALRTVIKARGQ